MAVRSLLNGLSDLLDALEEVKETEDVNFLVFRNEYAKANKLINNFLDEQLIDFSENLLKKHSSKVRSCRAGKCKCVYLLCTTNPALL